MSCVLLKQSHQKCKQLQKSAKQLLGRSSFSTSIQKTSGLNDTSSKMLTLFIVKLVARRVRCFPEYFFVETLTNTSKVCYCGRELRLNIVQLNWNSIRDFPETSQSKLICQKPCKFFYDLFIEFCRFWLKNFSKKLVVNKFKLKF